MLIIEAPTRKQCILSGIRTTRDYLSTLEDGLKAFASDVAQVDQDANLTKIERQQKVDLLTREFTAKYGKTADDADARIGKVAEDISSFMSQGRYDDGQLVSALGAIREHGDSLPESMVEQIVEDAKSQAGWARLVCKAMRKADIQSSTVLDLGEYVGLLDAVANVNLDTVRDMVWCAARSPLTHRDMHEPLNTLNRLEDNVKMLHD